MLKARQGVIYGIAAYGLWGLIPLYFKAVAEVAPSEVLAHRAFWSFVTLAVFVGITGRWKNVGTKLKSGKVVLMLVASGVFIALNWLGFIYAVETKQVLEASLAYFVTPLLNVLLGVVLFHERLRPLQLLSIALAATGVAILMRLAGHFPWLGLELAITFSLYSVMRKIIPLDNLVGLTAETCLLAPLGLAYLGYLYCTSRLTGGPPLIGWLMLAGPVTTVPLVCFAAAVSRLRLSTIAFLQYLSPTLQFLLAVIAFREPFSTDKLVSFMFIWTAVAIFTFDGLRGARPASLEVVEPD